MKYFPYAIYSSHPIKTKFEDYSYPKPCSTYHFKNSDIYGQFRFITTNQNALFSQITFTNEDGKKGIKLKSTFNKELHEFLQDNDIPTKKVPYSDFEYSCSCGITSYYTTDLAVCQKLYGILRTWNTFNIDDEISNSEAIQESLNNLFKAFEQV